ncbi:MAG: hypothetical protein H6872_11185 [Methylobacteriaceae bacterium]|nr:hypothetical protein [Methylobacteriaceae bacterium]
MSADAPSLEFLAKTGHDLVYERMQNGRVFGAEAQVLSFRGEAGGRARLSGFRRLVARRPGIAPGDIVYDYDVAHLLHDFISRAKHPTFYDAFPLRGLDDLVGRLVVQWPKPYMHDVCARRRRGIRRRDIESSAAAEDRAHRRMPAWPCRPFTTLSSVACRIPAGLMPALAKRSGEASTGLHGD